VAIPATQEDNDVDDFVNPPSHMKKVISTEAFTKGGGRKKGSMKMSISNILGVKKVS
jgi:hypothetical protein